MGLRFVAVAAGVVGALMLPACGADDDAKAAAPDLTEMTHAYCANRKLYGSTEAVARLRREAGGAAQAVVDQVVRAADSQCPTPPTTEDAHIYTGPAAPTATAPPPAPSTTAAATLPNGAPLFDGYPKLVAIASLDRRVNKWFTMHPGTSDQAVALAPGVYAPYNPNVPDLSSYLDGPASGDCAMLNKYFPDAGGACWSGVR